MQPDIGTTPAAAQGLPAGDGAARGVSIDEVAFDVVLLVFLGALLVTMPSSESARLVPLLVLIPTMLGTAYQLYVDLTPGRHADEAAETEPTAPDVRRRQGLFVAWLLAYFAAAWLTSFLLIIPIALFTVFRFANRESMLLSVGLTVGMSAFIFVLFGLVLGIRF